MLCPADAKLVRRDPQLPGLGTLLDGAEFAAMLDRLYPEAGVKGVEPRYVRYKPGTSCLVGYRVEVGPGPLDVYARALNPRITAKIEKAAERHSVPSPLEGGIKVLSDTAVVVYPFPNDHELRALQWLEPPAARREMLKDLFPDRAELWEARLETLRYKPERRYVGHLRAPADLGAVLKLYTREDFHTITDNVDTFVNRPPLRVPRRLSRSKRYRAAAMEWLEGSLLRDAMARPDAGADLCRLVGASLACVHSQKPKKLHTSCTAESYAQSLAEGALAVSDIAPDLGERAQRLARRIGDLLVRRHWRSRRAIHGDFSADQVILQNGTAAIVDFDRAGYGDPRIDLGSFRAKLAFDVMGGVLAESQADACFTALLEEYRLASAKDVTRKVDRFTAASLLLSAVEPFRHRHADWRGEMETLVAQAERLAERRGGES